MAEKDKAEIKRTWGIVVIAVKMLYCAVSCYWLGCVGRACRWAMQRCAPRA